MKQHTSPRVRIRRVPKNARYDRRSIYRVLDRRQVGDVSFTDGRQPYCIPTLHARVENRLLIHRPSASRMIRLLPAGAPTCLSVTMLDGLVLACSAFEHTANYDLVVLLGTVHPVDGSDEKLAARKALTEALVPGSLAEV